MELTSLRTVKNYFLTDWKADRQWNKMVEDIWAMQFMTCFKAEVVLESCHRLQMASEEAFIKILKILFKSKPKSVFKYWARNSKCACFTYMYIGYICVLI